MKQHISYCILLVLLIGCGFGEGTKTDTGRVVKVIDGDTYDILIDGKQTRIRMYGIDAPERGMDFFKVSKEYLGDLCKGNTIKVVTMKKDRHNRVVAKSYLPDGRELGAEMLKAGLAWHYKKYSSDSDYAAFEQKAKENKLGLWSMPIPTPPWEYRKMRRNKELY